MLTRFQLAFALMSLAGVACAPAAGQGPSSTSAPAGSGPAGAMGSAGMANMPPMSSAEMANMPPTDASGVATPSAAPSSAADETAAYDKAKPVFDAYCAKCHTTQGSKSSKKSLEHFNMDAYPFGGHHADEITSVIREVLGASGEKATMPRDKPGAVKGDELKLVLAWADAYDRAHPTKAGEHHHDHDDDSDEHEHEGHAH